MTTSIIDESQRKAARVAGFTFLFAMAIVVLCELWHQLSPSSSQAMLQKPGAGPSVAVL